MTSAFALQATFEIVFVILLIIGLIFEDKVADFEQSVFRRIKRAFRLDKGRVTAMRRAEIITISRQDTGA